MNIAQDVLLQASGLLNNPILPKIEGYSSFNGRIIHTAQWPSDFGEEQWKGQKVVVIGAGASSVQTVPGMQPHVDELHVFIRSKTWLASAGPESHVVSKGLHTIDSSGTESEGYLVICRKIVRQNPLYTYREGLWELISRGPVEKREEFRLHPEKLVEEARLHEGPVNLMWASMFKISPLQEEAVKVC